MPRRYRDTHKGTGVTQRNIFLMLLLMHLPTWVPQPLLGLTTPYIDTRVHRTLRMSEIFMVISANHLITSKSAVFLILQQMVCSYGTIRVPPKLVLAEQSVTDWVRGDAGEQDASVMEKWNKKQQVDLNVV